MKRKLLCLFLALVTVMSCFAAAGCSKDDDELVEGETTDESALTTVTLTLWLPTDEDTTEEAVLAVQEAINKITKAKFETAIELRAIPSDEYEAAVDARLTEIEEAIAFEKAEAERKRKEAKELAAMGITTAAEETTAEDEASEEADETFVNDIGMTVVRYPEVEENQMDIFLVRGLDSYKAYIERKALSQLDTEINGTQKILKQYIYPDFLTHAKINNGTYAVPNNHPIGEYKFLLVNKKLVDQLYWDPDELTTLVNCEQFILDVAEYTDVQPFAGEVEPYGLYYWSADGEWSIIASQLDEYSNYNTYVGPRNILTLPNVTNTMYLKKLLTEKDLIVADPTSVDEFGVAVIAGDAFIREQYEEDYYVYIHEHPRGNEQNLYEAMFAVSAYTKSVSRSMEIITQLNTDPELRTILQYGVEDIHWRASDDESKTIDIISDDYKMNLVETGNVYMTYPAEGVSMEYWETMKKQNLDMLVSPYLGMNREDYVTEPRDVAFAEFAKMSAEYKAKIDAMTADEFKSELAAMRKEITFNQFILEQFDSSNPDNIVGFYVKFQQPRAK